MLNIISHKRGLCSQLKWSLSSSPLDLDIIFQRWGRDNNACCPSRLSFIKREMICWFLSQFVIIHLLCWVWEPDLIVFKNMRDGGRWMDIWNSFRQADTRKKDYIVPTWGGQQPGKESGRTREEKKWFELTFNTPSLMVIWFKLNRHGTNVLLLLILLVLLLFK